VTGLDIDECDNCFRVRKQQLRDALVEHGLWTEQSIDEDVMPGLQTIEDVREYEECLKAVD
jgi:hypothetical protein